LVQFYLENDERLRVKIEIKRRYEEKRYRGEKKTK